MLIDGNRNHYTFDARRLLPFLKAEQGFGTFTNYCAADNNSLHSLTWLNRERMLDKAHFLMNSRNSTSIFKFDLAVRRGCCLIK